MTISTGETGLRAYSHNMHSLRNGIDSKAEALSVAYEIQNTQHTDNKTIHLIIKSDHGILFPERKNIFHQPIQKWSVSDPGGRGSGLERGEVVREDPIQTLYWTPHTQVFV